eukprot:2707552-Pyramimonas_sp.AAC.1
MFSGFTLKSLIPGKASYLLGWGEAGLSGIVTVRVPNVEAGIGHYRQCLSDVRAALPPSSAASHILLSDFKVAPGDEGRFDLATGAASREGSAFSREWGEYVGGWAELHQPQDTRRACPGPKIVLYRSRDRVPVAVAISTKPRLLHGPPSDSSRGSVHV